MPDTVEMAAIGPTIKEAAAEPNNQAIYDEVVHELGYDPLDSAGWDDYRAVSQRYTEAHAHLKKLATEEL